MAAQVPTKPATTPVLGDAGDMKGVLMRLSHARLLRALRAEAAKRRGLEPWHFILLVGFGIWLLLRLNESIGWISVESNELLIAGIQLVAGLLLIEAASEALILATDRTGARFNWDGFT